MIEHIEHKRDIRLDAFDLGLTQCADRLASGIFKASAVRSHFQKQGIVERRDRRALEAVAAVQSDAETARRTIGFDGSGIRHEVIRRILGRDTALDRVPGHLDRVLAWNANFLRRQRVSFRDQNLRLHDIDTGYHFGDGMLYLNTRVHFDEIVLACGWVEQELYCTCRAIVHRLCNLDCVRADGFALCVSQAKRRRKFDDLLVTSLDGAVTLKKMHDIARLVAQNLHFDVFRVLKVFFNKNIINAKSLGCFGTCGTELRQQLFLCSDDSHTASAAAGCCLEHHRIAAGIREFQCFCFCFNCFFHARYCRYADRVRHELRLDFVTERVHHISRRSDKLDAFICACLRKFRVLRQETVSRMDGIDTLGLCQRDDLIDAQISADRGLALTDLVCFISFRSE